MSAAIVEERLRLAVIEDMLHGGCGLVDVERSGDLGCSLVVGSVDVFVSARTLEDIGTQRIVAGRHIVEHLIEVERALVELGGLCPIAGIAVGRCPACLAVVVEIGILQHIRQVERLFHIAGRHAGEEGYTCRTCLLDKLAHLLALRAGFCLILYVGKRRLQHSIGSLYILRVGRLSKFADAGKHFGQFGTCLVDVAVVEVLGFLCRQDEPSLRGGRLGDVPRRGPRLAVGIGDERRRVGGAFRVDDVIAAMTVHVHSSAHQVEVVGSGGLGVLSGLDAAGIGHVVSAGGIAQLVVLIVGREGQIPGGSIVGSSIFDIHRLPLQLVVVGLHEIGAVQTVLRVLVLDVVLHAVFVVERIVG